MPTVDLSALTTAFIEKADLFMKAVLEWDLRGEGVQIRTNVKAPQAMTKLSAQGSPRPYRAQADYTGATLTDRLLTVFQSKLDVEVDPEDLRNTYLATLPEATNFSDYVVSQAARQYLETIGTTTLWGGVRNAAGSTAADLCSGWGTIIAAEITATKLTPVATGAITAANAVDKIDQVVAAAPIRMKKKGGIVKVSYDVFDKYCKHYATKFGFQFNPSATGEYRINNTKFVLQPWDIMGTSQRVVLTVAGNLVFGTDVEGLSMYPETFHNIIRNRMMMPVGCQIQDLDELVVNDQA